MLLKQALFKGVSFRVRQLGFEQPTTTPNAVSYRSYLAQSVVN